MKNKTNVKFLRETIIERVPMESPNDISGIQTLFDTHVLEPHEVVAIFGKTEGNGCVNDFTRAYSIFALTKFFADKLSCSDNEVSKRVSMVMSGGTEGGLSPHYIVIGVREHSDGILNQSPSLAIGTAYTRNFKPEEIGRLAMIREVAKAVSVALKRSGIDDKKNVHFVQVKCPLLTSERITDANSRGETVCTEDTYESMAYSRGASALGVALALDEVESNLINNKLVLRDLSIYSEKASASAGVELLNCEVIVMGNSMSWNGPLLVSHEIMRDAIDSQSVWQVLSNLEIYNSKQLSKVQGNLISAVLCKAEPSSNGKIRDARHIMLDDSDINSTRHSRALVGGVISGVVGFTDLFISGGAEHQGPDGGGPLAIIAKKY